MIAWESAQSMSADTDGVWPAAPVRDLVEDLESDAFDCGLRSGKINSRGLMTWSPTEGAPATAPSRSSSASWPTASPISRAPRPSCANWRMATRRGRAGRMIDPRSSSTAIPESVLPAAGCAAADMVTQPRWRLHRPACR